MAFGANDLLAVNVRCFEVPDSTVAVLAGFQRIASRGTAIVASAGAIGKFDFAAGKIIEAK